MKHLKIISLSILFSFSLFSVQAAETDHKTMTAEQIAEKERCTVPSYAKLIGHDELWKKHNGCPTKEDMKKDE